MKPGRISLENGLRSHIFYVVTLVLLRLRGPALCGSTSTGRRSLRGKCGTRKLSAMNSEYPALKFDRCKPRGHEGYKQWVCMYRYIPRYSQQMFNFCCCWTYPKLREEKWCTNLQIRIRTSQRHGNEVKLKLSCRMNVPVAKFCVDNTQIFFKRCDMYLAHDRVSLMYQRFETIETDRSGRISEE